MLYLVGPPGVGKSTVLELVLELMELKRGEPTLIFERDLWAEPLWGDGNYCVGVALGKSVGTTARAITGFPGTDRLSMQVQPQALRWLASGELPNLVVGEGQRLGNAKFLSAAAVSTELLVVRLWADEVSLDARCAERGSAQSEQFRKAATTGSANALNGARAAGARTAELDTTNLSSAEVAEAVYCLM